jgi:hypothetical protein
MTAFTARPVPSGKGRHFIKEEKLGIPVRCHNGPADSLEFQYAGQPAPDLGGPHDLLVVIMQDPAVTEQRAPLGGGDNLAEWRDAIL